MTAGKEISARSTEIKKEYLGVTTHFSEILTVSKIILKHSKMQSNVWFFFFQIEALLSLKSAWLCPNYFWIIYY